MYHQRSENELRKRGKWALTRMMANSSRLCPWKEGRGGTPSHGIGVTPDGKTLWVNSVLANAVFAYSLPDLKVLGYAALPTLELEGRHAIGAVPDWLTFAPDSKTVYIANSSFRTVSAIDAKTIKEVVRIRVGEVPKGMNTLVVPLAYRVPSEYLVPRRGDCHAGGDTNTSSGWDTIIGGNGGQKAGRRRPQSSRGGRTPEIPDPAIQLWAWPSSVQRRRAA